MNRIQHFLSNAGKLGTAQTVVVSLAVVALVAFSFKAGDIEFIVAAVLFAAGVAYAARGYLVDHVGFAQWLMNIAAVGTPITLFVFQEHLDVEKFWVRCSASAWATLYLGCYFWMLSDPSITRDR